MSNSEVVRNWSKGKGGKSDHLLTNGHDLFSYKLKIGFTGEDGYKYVYNYTAHKDTDRLGNKVREEYVSMTTSHHISIARRVGYSCPPPERR